MSVSSVRVFCSYSHKDESHKEDLIAHLAPLRRQGLIEVWHDRDISAGADIHGNISGELERADIILLLVSAAFVASDYCFDREMVRALERHQNGECRVIPVIVRACDWAATPFSDLMAVPRDGVAITAWPDKDQALTDVAKSIRKVVEELLASRSRNSHVPDPEPKASAPLTELPEPSQRGLDFSAKTRVRKGFSDLDKDRFMEATYETIAEAFETSLRSLSANGSGMSGSFRRIDAVHFTATIYANGKALARCKIWHGGGHSTLSGICYSTNQSLSDSGMNESLSLEATPEGMFLKPMGMAMLRGDWSDKPLSPVDAANYLWQVFIARL